MKGLFFNKCLSSFNEIPTETPTTELKLASLYVRSKGGKYFAKLNMRILNVKTDELSKHENKVFVGFIIANVLRDLTVYSYRRNLLLQLKYTVYLLYV